ncbi:hypothetical protein Trydic_g12660 [Trypoxylus dichotomus]
MIIRQCIGEHDLDRPIDDLYHFVEKIKFPMIVANLHFENDAYLRYKLRPSLIVRLDADADVAVGVIGYVASANSFLLPANSSFRYEDEVVAVRRECAELRRQGADVIVALGYAGFAVDRRIAAEVEDVDVVVGGLTNSLLWNGPAPDDAEANGQRVNGPYPTIVVQEASGKRVPIVQTYGFAKYVGRLRLSYDDGDDDSSRDAGTRTTVTVVEGDPIFLSADVPTDNEMSNALAGYQPTLRDMKQEQAVLGQSIIPLTADDAYNSESNLANFATDSILEFGIFQGYATSSSFVLLHAGAFRGQLATSKERPNITRMALEEAIPCYHKLIYVQIKGSYIKQALEDGISRLDGNSFLHGAGLRFDVDTGATKNDRVKSARTLCMAGEEPRYCPLDQTKDYRFLSVAYFLTQGGHDVLRYQGSLTTLTYDLMDAFVYIFNTFGIVVLDLDNRIFQYRRGESLKKGDLSSATIPTSFVLRFIHIDNGYNCVA